MKNKKALLGAAVLLAAAAVMLFVWKALAPVGAEGEKTIAVEVVHGDGTSQTFTLETEQAYLGPALVEGGLVEDDQGPYGLYILTVDGETADERAQQWWKITKGGARVDTGADTTPIADGDQFELTLTTLTLTTGYDGL